MTRFLLTIEQAVDTVFEAIRSARPGEPLVPNAPSATVMDIAQVLVGSRKVAVSITGVRPGEKLREILVAEDEVFRCMAHGDRF